jgi:hypothetical protein
MTAEGEAGLFTIPYERQVVGDWGVISLTATLPELQLEYYDPGLVKDGEARQYEYNWPGDYAVDVFKVQVQQPMGAGEMSISPSSGQGVTGSDGLVYYNKEVGALLAGQTFSLKINYKKSSDDLTAANLQVQPSAPVTITSERNNLLAILPWTLGALGVVLMGGSSFAVGKGKEKSPPAAVIARPPKSPATESHILPPPRQTLARDRFCRMWQTKD